MKSDLLTIPVPNATDLAHLTRQVAKNNGFNRVPDATEAATMQFPKSHIKHIIYIVK